MSRSGMRTFCAGLALRALALAVLACGGMAPAAAADKEDGPFAGLSGTLLVCKEYGTVLGTYLTDLRGKDIARLNYFYGEGVNPRFSPTDDRVLFSCTRGGAAGVWMTNRQGQEPKRICDGDQGDWFPDGLRIVFRRQGRIVTRSLQTGEESVITPAGSKTCAHPACAPDGRRVLFLSMGGDWDNLLLATLGDKGEPRFIALGMLGPPRWSPTGRRFALQIGSHLWTMDPNATEGTVQLTTWGGVQRRPAWSPDGSAIAFCQGPGPKGPWTMAVVRADGSGCAAIPPGSARSVLCSDWGPQKPGQKAELHAAPARPQARVRLWDLHHVGGAPVRDWAAFCREREGWTAVAADANGPPVTSGCAVEDDQEVFVLVRGSARAVLVPKSAPGSAVSFSLCDSQGRQAGPLESASVMAQDRDAVILESSSHSPGGVVKALWAVGGTRMCVQVTPDENAARLRVEVPMQCVVAPDRFGNDLIADPEALGDRRAMLPWAPMVAGLFAGGSRMLVLACPVPGQRMELWAGKGPSIAGAEVALGKGPVLAEVFAGEKLWHMERFPAEGQADPLRFKWRPPMPATWRLAVQSGARRDSAFFSDKESTFFDGKDVLFPKGKDLPAAGRLGVIYLYGRTAATPPDAMTPLDLMRDVLGRAASQQALDEDGLTGYRRAAAATTWAEISVTIEALRYLFERQLEVQDSVYAGHLCDDLLPFVEGLDQRLKEYADFTRELRLLGKPSEQAGPEGPKLLAGMAAMVGKLGELGEVQGTLKSPKEILPLCAKIRQLTAKPSGENRKQFEECCKAILAAVGPREEMLRSYRKLAVDLRDAAGSAPLTQPELVVAAEKVRALCQGVLRNRFYVEADWRGEDYEVPAYWLGPRPYE